MIFFNFNLWCVFVKCLYKYWNFKKNLLLGIKDFILIILDSKNGRILKNLSLNGF